MIIATPLDLPNLEPDNWEVFWQLWKENAAPLVKRSMNTDYSIVPVNDSTLWIGMDIFKKEFRSKIDNRALDTTHWDAQYVDISSLLPNFYKSLESLPINNIFRVRLISNLKPIPAHTDDNSDKWSIRYFLYNENTQPVWYFTPPGVENKNNKSYFSLPEETNWVAYNDKHCWHGSDYDHTNKKILMQVYYFDYPDQENEIIYSSIEKFKNNVLSYE